MFSNKILEIIEQYDQKVKQLEEDLKFLQGRFDGHCNDNIKMFDDIIGRESCKYTFFIGERPPEKQGRFGELYDYLGIKRDKIENKYEFNKINKKKL